MNTLLVKAVTRRAATQAAVELSALVRESVAADAAREVLHLHLAGLDPALCRPHHRRMIREALDVALAAARTRVFDLPNGDVVAVARAPAPALEAAATLLRESLDSLAPAVVRRLRLPEEAAQLLSAAADSLGLGPGAAPATTAAPGLVPGSADLAAAERAIASADLDSVTQAQAVCRLDPEGGAAEPLWEDRRIAWPALAAILLPGRDLSRAPALAQRLARSAEQRMLIELARPSAQLDWRPVGLPLAPTTLAGPGFARFIDSLPTGRRTEVTVGLRPAELLAEPAAARLLPGLAAQGVRLALDDAAPALAALLPALLPGGRLGVELLRLAWHPALPAEVPPALAHLLESTPERVVLVGVDRPAAIAWGWEAGLRLFQGPLVERRRRGG